MNQSLVKTKTRSHVNTNRLIIKFASKRIGQSIQRYRQHKSALAPLRSVSANKNEITCKIFLLPFSERIYLQISAESQTVYC